MLFSGIGPSGAGDCIADVGDIPNLCFRRSKLLYNPLDTLAKSTEDEDAFMKQGVLRRLLVGGLFTEERDGRHRNSQHLSMRW